jgi:hypothetical protein
MAIVSIAFNPLDGSAALAADAGQDTATSTADSKAVAALANASTADSKAVVGIADASEAESKADLEAGKGDSAALLASTADSKAVVGQTAASTADSKAVIADSIADAAKALADSAIGSEPAVGEYKVTDIDRNSDGSIVINYDDSCIT